MEIKIDPIKMEVTGLTPQEVLILFFFNQRESYEETMKGLISKGLVSTSELGGAQKEGAPPEYYLTKTAINLLNTLQAESIIHSSSSEERLNTLAKTLKEMFPKGKKPGTNIYWAEGIVLIKRRLKLFFKKYGNFEDDIIIDATKRYIDSFYSDIAYMKTLKYFIFKEALGVAGDVEPSSDLISYIENKDDDEEIKNSQNWTQTLI